MNDLTTTRATTKATSTSIDDPMVTEQILTAIAAEKKKNCCVTGLRTALPVHFDPAVCDHVLGMLSRAETMSILWNTPSGYPCPIGRCRNAPASVAASTTDAAVGTSPAEFTSVTSSIVSPISSTIPVTTAIVDSLPATVTIESAGMASEQKLGSIKGKWVPWTRNGFDCLQWEGPLSVPFGVPTAPTPAGYILCTLDIKCPPGGPSKFIVQSYSALQPRTSADGWICMPAEAWVDAA